MTSGPGTNPRVAGSLTASARATSANWRARCRWDAQSFPVARCASGTSTSVTRIPARSRSMVSAVSTPNPAASGRAASNAARVRQRCPFRAGQPDHQAVPALADPFGEHRDRHVGIARAHRFGERAGRARGVAQVRV